MALPPRDESSPPTGFSEINEELAAARDALLLFADAEGVLRSLVCDPSDPECRYPDLAAVRSHATVDELLHVVGRIPETGEEDRGEEARSLYPTLLELAELFDILIDQFSLVYGDAVALAESMQGGWHAMAGCFNHDPSPEDATLALKQVTSNLGKLPAIIEQIDRLGAEGRREVVARFDAGAGEPWRAEARYFAVHALDTWVPQGISDPRIARAIQPARERPTTGLPADPARSLSRATADLVLAHLVTGIARELVPQILQAPFVGLLQNS